MTKFIKTLVVILALSILATSCLNAQLFEIPLNMKIEVATLIVEGEVTKSESYFGTDNETYTAHEIEISKILKGTRFSKSKLTVITLGGDVGGHMTTWSHLLTLEKGERGVFFLTPTNRPAIGGRKGFPDNSFEVFSSLQGFLRYRTEGGETTAVDPFNKYDNPQMEVFGEVARLTNEVMKIVEQPNSSVDGDEAKCVIYSFEPISEFAGFSIGADIKVRTANGSYKLYESLVVVEYDTSFFGAKVVENGNLVVQDGDISSSSAYTLTATDLAANRLELKLVPTGDLASLSTITEQRSWLARIHLSIENPLGNFAVGFDYDDMGQGNLYYDEGLREAKMFECIKIESDAFPLACPNPPQITSFNPERAAAGAGSASPSGVPGVITITGSNFGEPPAGSIIQKPDNFRVGFTNAGKDQGWVYPPERDYVSWTSTEIVVRVPSAGYDDSNGFSFEKYAGTGPIKVERTDMDNCWAIGDTLYVPFVAQNSALFFSTSSTRQSIPMKMADRDDDGGYSLYFTDEFKNLAGATGAFTRALNTWRCNVFVNFDIREKADIPNMDGACEIDFGPLPAGTAATTVAKTTGTPQPCPGNSHSFLPNFKIIFYSNIETSPGPGGIVNLFWYTGVNGPDPELNYFDTIDLETVALHELGHALLLGHTLNENNVMYTPTKVTRRMLTGDDKDGGHHTVRISSQAPNCEGVMDTLTMTDCSISSVKDIMAAEDLLNIFPNPVDEILTIEWKARGSRHKLERVRIFNVLGQQLYSFELDDHPLPIEIGTKSLNPGYYFLLIEADGNRPDLVHKLVKR